MSAFRLYAPDEVGKDGYPEAWHKLGEGHDDLLDEIDSVLPGSYVGLKDVVRARAGDRCLRCGHPYSKGDGEWSACDWHCQHDGPIRYRFGEEKWCDFGMVADLGWPELKDRGLRGRGAEVQAQWRILTVHHLDQNKANCRWWNLVALCQRDHLIVQRRVVMDRAWPWEHSDWFKPYVAGFYAFKYLGLDLSREETEARLEELLDLGKREESVERMAL
jgi:hypothetical protein